jgi:hypothetical protein
MLTEIGPDKRGLRFVRDLAGDRGERFLQLSRVQFGLMKTGEGGSKAIFWMKDGVIVEVDLDRAATLTGMLRRTFRANEREAVVADTCRQGCGLPASGPWDRAGATGLRA